MGGFRDGKVLPAPHKRPSQARSRFTVATLYEAFVRIWRRDGPAAVSMRGIAAEAGYAVGTLYEYFPNRAAVLSGYFLFCLDDLCRRARRADPGDALPWPDRLRCLVAVTLDLDGTAPYFDADMLLQESLIAGAPQHERAFARLRDALGGQLREWPDLPPPDDETIEAFVIHLWGAQRYAILLRRRKRTQRELQRTTAMLQTLLETDR